MQNRTSGYQDIRMEDTGVSGYQGIKKIRVSKPDTLIS
jgi:hypothetical protein